MGDDIDILVDANTGYNLDDVRRVMLAFEALNVDWLEESFPAYGYDAYARATKFGRVPLAAGENHYTCYEFDPLLQVGNATCCAQSNNEPPCAK